MKNKSRLLKKKILYQLKNISDENINKKKSICFNFFNSQNNFIKI